MVYLSSMHASHTQLIEKDGHGVVLVNDRTRLDRVPLSVLTTFT